MTTPNSKFDKSLWHYLLIIYKILANRLVFELIVNREIKKNKKTFKSKIKIIREFQRYLNRIIAFRNKM